MKDFHFNYFEKFFACEVSLCTLSFARSSIRKAQIALVFLKALHINVKSASEDGASIEAVYDGFVLVALDPVDRFVIQLKEERQFSVILVEHVLIRRLPRQH